MTSRTLLRLDQAPVYHSYHEMQDRDADVALQKYKQKIKLGNKYKIMDVGCGPGDFTYNYLLPLIPKDGKIIGIDISQPMIDFANSTYEDSRLSFETMDITSSSVDEKYIQTFDAIFSFHCLHWIQDQRNAMKNIYNMLKTGGETLLIFLASSPIYTLYEMLAVSPKWSHYMQDYKQVISPYHYSTDPVTDVGNLMRDIGFHVKECFCTPTSYTVKSEEILYKCIQAVNPFLNRIPKHLHDEYNEECKQKIWKANLCSVEKTKEITFHYSLITIYAYKPH